MTIRIQDGLSFVTIRLQYRDRHLDLPNVLLDTGSAGTIFSADQVLAIGLQYEADDPVHRIRGIGGAEFVFSKRVDSLSLGVLRVSDFDIEVGAMAYGIEMDGIVGLDFLIQVGAVIDLQQLEVRQR